MLIWKPAILRLSGSPPPKGFDNHIYTQAKQPARKTNLKPRGIHLFWIGPMVYNQNHAWKGDWPLLNANKNSLALEKRKLVQDRKRAQQVEQEFAIVVRVIKRKRT